MLENITSKEEFINLRKEIDKVLDELDNTCPTEDEYDDLLKTLDTLTSIQSKLAETQCKMVETDCKVTTVQKKKVSPDTVAVIAGNLLGIGLILGFEKMNIITSKAIGFVLKGRV